MKKMIVAMAACAGMTGFSAVAQAGETGEIGGYVGAGLGLFTLGYKDTTVNQRGTSFGGVAKLGYNLTPIVGGEVRLGFAGSNTKYYTGTVNTRKLSSAYLVSYLAKFHFQPDTGLSLYALVGGTTAKFRMATNASSNAATKTGLSYGAGIDYALYGDWDAGVEWMQYWNNVKLGGVFGTNAKARIMGVVADASYHF